MSTSEDSNVLYEFEVALVGKDEASVREILRDTRWVNERDTSNNNLLHYLLKSQDNRTYRVASLIPLLIECGLDIEAREGMRAGRTALGLAVSTGTVDATEALLALGADVDAVDAHGKTPLAGATMLLDEATARTLIPILLAAGANPDAALPSGGTVREFALSLGNRDFSDLF